MTPKSSESDSRPFEVLGVTEAEEAAYRWLLAHARGSVREVASAMRISLAQCQRLLGSMETKGLVTDSAERPRRYLPVSPDMALEALFARRERDMKRARTAMLEVRQIASARRQHEPEPFVELITDHETSRQTYEQMMRTAQHEFLTLVRAPLLFTVLGSTGNEGAQRAAARGVHFRGITDLDFLGVPGIVPRMKGDILSGEEFRVFSKLPLKMAIADRRFAILPLNLVDPTGPSLLVRSSALLDALYALFEALWERSSPLSFSGDGTAVITAVASKHAKDVEELTALMATGLNDKAIAHQLGVSKRTLNRRILELVRDLDARSRFQAGWVAASRRAARSVHNDATDDAALPAARRRVQSRAQRAPKR
jgi:predicted DNA-binding transcriptional regulator